jgi:hypothetical protein
MSIYVYVHMPQLSTRGMKQNWSCDDFVCLLYEFVGFQRFPPVHMIHMIPTGGFWVR